jgi:hypothetical protein
LTKLGIIVCLLSIAPLARAQRVEIGASGEASIELEPVVRELMSRLSVELEWSGMDRIDPREVLAPREAQSGLVARVWIDLGDPDRAAIFVANGDHDHFLVRFVPITDGYDELARESLAHIVESAVDALLGGGVIGVSREAASRELHIEPVVIAEPVPPVEVPAQLPPRSVIEIGIAPYYSAWLFASSPLSAHGPGVAITVGGEIDGALRWTSWASAQYLAPIEHFRDPAGVRLDGGSARILGGVELRWTEIAVRMLAGVGADIFHAQPHVRAGAGFMASDAFALPIPVASAMAAIDLRIARWISAFVALGIDLDLAGTRFDVEAEGRVSESLAPLGARPSSTIGVLIVP